MKITFGKHEGKQSEVVVLKHASYVRWVLEQEHATSGLAMLRADVKQLIVRFDSMPFVKRCSKCKQQATLVSGYWNNDSTLYPWCDKCDPYWKGALEGKLSKLRSYRDALQHVELRCGATKAGYDRIVRALAEAKGLPDRVGVATAAKFFGESGPALRPGGV